MSKDKYFFKQELDKLCVKCTTLSESTARKYSNRLYNEFSKQDGCISYFSEDDFYKLRKEMFEIKNALQTLKSGFIESKDCFLRIEDISHIEFKENQILITNKQNKTYSYSNDFKFLKHIF